MSFTSIIPLFKVELSKFETNIEFNNNEMLCRATFRVSFVIILLRTSNRALSTIISEITITTT